MYYEGDWCVCRTRRVIFLYIIFPRREWQAMDPQAAYNIPKISDAFNMFSTQQPGRVFSYCSSIK